MSSLRLPETKAASWWKLKAQGSWPMSEWLSDVHSPPGLCHSDRVANCQFTQDTGLSVLRPKPWTNQNELVTLLNQHKGNNQLLTNNTISRNFSKRNNQVSIKISIKGYLSCACICGCMYPYSEKQTRKQHQNIYNHYCQILWSWVIFNFSLLTLSLSFWQWFLIRNIRSSFKH